MQGVRREFRLAFTTTLSQSLLKRLCDESVRRNCRANLIVEEALRKHLGMPPLPPPPPTSPPRRRRIRCSDLEKRETKALTQLIHLLEKKLLGLHVQAKKKDAGAADEGQGVGHA